MSELIIEKFDGSKQWIWDPSSWEALTRCPRYYQLRVLEGYRWPFDGAAIGWGKLFHSSLEAFDTARFQGESWNEAVRAAIKEALVGRDALADSSDNTRTIDTLTRAVVWYAIQFRDDALKLASMPDGEPALEVRFEVPIPGTDYRLSGRMDKLAHLSKELYIVERKTTKKTLNDHYFNYYNPNTQVEAYIWATRRGLNMDVAGLMIEACQTMVSGTRFGRCRIDKTDEQLDEFERDLRYYIGQAETFAEQSYWPMNRSSCGNFGGCDYRKVCSRSGAIRHHWLGDMTKKPYGSRKPK